MDKVFFFGGFSSNLPTVTGPQHVWNFAYFADTFMLDTSDPSKSNFKQVNTRGFPNYRAKAHFVVDDTTGKTYLFSGYVNAEFVRSEKKGLTRNYMDLWQLRTDVENGFFEGVDVDQEARTERAGSFQRCFSCGSAGPWRKCGGRI